MIYMRLWHYELLNVLPRQQLLSQLRECVAIAKDIYKTDNTNHILINPIMDYNLNHFRLYCVLVVNEMEKRGYNVSRTTKDKLHTYIQYYNTLKYVTFAGRLSILINNEYEPLFNDWHNDRYLVQCLYNLEEKYDRGGVSQEEWDKIYHKYYQYIDF